MDGAMRIDDAQILGALQRLLDLGQHTAPTMGAIARVGESSTRERFRTQIGPDGQRWKPSLRAQLTGGRTLTRDGHLAGSVGSNYGKDYAEWGVNRIYAVIHQEGREIRALGGSLRFRLANGAYVMVKKVTIPARPFLGVSEDDADDILDVIERRVQAASGGSDAH